MTITYGLIGSEPYDSRKALINGRVYSQFLVACYARYQPCHLDSLRCEVRAKAKLIPSPWLVFMLNRNYEENNIC
jgi:hypothetical protein